MPQHGQPERLQTGREGDDRGQHPAAVRRRLHLQAARGGRQQLAVPPAGELAGGVSTGAGESARGQHAGVRHPGPGHGHGWGPWPAVPPLVTGPSWPPGYKG